MSKIVLEDIHIHNIAVKKEYRGMGIGGKMISHLIEDSITNHAGRLCLEVKNSNLPAIKLYQKHGFVPVGERKNYYEDGSNAVLMDRTF